MEHRFVGSPEGGSPMQVLVSKDAEGKLYADSNCTIRLCDVGNTCQASSP